VPLWVAPNSCEQVLVPRAARRRAATTQPGSGVSFAISIFAGQRFQLSVAPTRCAGSDGFDYKSEMRKRVRAKARLAFEVGPAPHCHSAAVRGYDRGGTDRTRPEVISCSDGAATRLQTLPLQKNEPSAQASTRSEFGPFIFMVA
jgi:hypothetical protein